MAQVNYNQGAGADVAPDTRMPDDYQHIQATPDDFGGAVAQGLEKGGQGAMSGLLQASSFYNQSAADQATNNVVDEGSKLLHGDPSKTTVGPDGQVVHDTGLLGKEGQSYMDAYQETRQGLRDIVEKHREDLSPEARLDYDRNSRRWLQQRDEEMGQRYDVAQRQWMVNNNTTAAKLTLDDISRNADNDKAFDGYTRDLAHSYLKTADVHGLGKAGADEAQSNALKDAWKTRLAAIAVTDPARAYQLAKQNQSALGTEGDGLVKYYQSAGEKAAVSAAVPDLIAQNIGKSTSELAMAPANLPKGSRVGEASYTAPTTGAQPGPGLGPGGVKPVAGKNGVPASGIMNAQDAIKAGINIAGIPGYAGTNPDGTPVKVNTPKLAADAAEGNRNIDSGKIAAGAVAAGAVPGKAQFAPGSFASAVGRTLKEEGGYNAKDANGVPVNFGINQAAHPEVDVSKLSQGQAAQIYKRDYWDKIGGDELSKSNPALAHVAFDAAVIAGPDRAKQWIAQSGGDPAKFMDLRDHYLSGLVASDPGTYAKYARTWQQRDNNLRADIGLAPRGETSFQGGQPALMGSPTGGQPEEPALQGAPQGVQPATFTPGATPAQATPPVDQQEPESLEDKVERLTLVKSATLAAALSQHPEWTFEQHQEAEKQINQWFSERMIAAQMDAHNQKVKKDALGEKVSGALLNGRPDQAFALIHDPANGLSNTERLTMADAVERRAGKADPATLGESYNDYLKRILAEPGAPDRIGIGDMATLYKGLVPDADHPNGALTVKGVAELQKVISGIQKSVDETGNMSMMATALDRMKDKVLHEEDIGGYHVRDPVGKTKLATFTNKMWTDFTKYREKGYDPKGFPLFDPAEADKAMDSIYPLRERLQSKYDQEAHAHPELDVMPPAPSGIHGQVWGEMMDKPPIIDNGTAIVPKSVWGTVVKSLLADPSPGNIAAFDSSIVGKAAGQDGALIIQGLTGRAPPLVGKPEGVGVNIPASLRGVTPAQEQREAFVPGSGPRHAPHAAPATQPTAPGKPRK